MKDNLAAGKSGATTFNMDWMLRSVSIILTGRRHSPICYDLHRRTYLVRP